MTGSDRDGPPPQDRVPEGDRLDRRRERMREDKKARDKRLGLRGRR